MTHRDLPTVPLLEPADHAWAEAFTARINQALRASIAAALSHEAELRELELEAELLEGQLESGPCAPEPSSADGASDVIDRATVDERCEELQRLYARIDALYNQPSPALPDYLIQDAEELDEAQSCAREFWPDDLAVMPEVAERMDMELSAIAACQAWRHFPEARAAVLDWAEGGGVITAEERDRYTGYLETRGAQAWQIRRRLEQAALAAGERGVAQGSADGLVSWALREALMNDTELALWRAEFGGWRGRFGGD